MSHKTVVRNPRLQLSARQNWKDGPKDAFRENARVRVLGQLYTKQEENGEQKVNSI